MNEGIRELPISLKRRSLFEINEKERDTRKKGEMKTFWREKRREAEEEERRIRRKQ